jgi:hypothetical protein
MTRQSHLFCFGYGYCSDALVRTLRGDAAQDWRFSGTTRDSDKRLMMEQFGIKSFLFDATQPLSDPQLLLRDVTHILISTPPDDDGDPVFSFHADDIVKLPNVQWIGYLSSTSVYGDRNGDWVDETSELRPTSKRGTRRAKAEGQWLSLYKKHNLPVHIFRLAGIYGAGRSAIDTIRAGIAQMIDKPGHVFNRIHIDDIVQILQASMDKPQAGRVYNLCDDLATPGHEILTYACNLLGIKPPPLIPFEESGIPPIARSFYKDNKQIRNDRVKTELSITLKHPDYRSGLQACLTAGRGESAWMERDDETLDPTG